MRKKIILNNEQIDISLNRLSCQLSENHGDFSETILVGLQPRGVSLCKKIADILEKKYNISNLNFSFLDITFFRDDFRTNNSIPSAHKTDFKLLVKNKNVVFIDDVLYTGRTIRAALTAIETFGRPKSIELLILVDRRYSRELPIQPDYKGVKVDLYDNQRVKVEWNNPRFGNYIYIENFKNE